MTARLHCFGESGNAYKVALMLALTGTPWRPVFVDFFNGETRSPAFRDLNPMGEVPVLEIDGRVLTQSAVMLRYLARRPGEVGPPQLGSPRLGPTELGPVDAAEEDEILRWMLWDNHKFSTQIGMLRFVTNFLPPERRPEGVAPFVQARLRAAYAVLERHLDARDWMVGGRATIADLSLCSYLYYPEPFGLDLADWPNVQAWTARIAALPGWAHPYALMPGNPSDRA
ncbi:glutathione S-transferase family protein [Pseudogemmobacter sonorensis]|uniref:glutathione S-transferase family protein n=1 Tax=Pseudogemmobacter sonorensis TaxID=2989681 RepID=UPI003681C4A8